MKGLLDAQRHQWQEAFSETPDMFGAASSRPARAAVELFQREGTKRILELGGGQGRDTLYFAENGFQVDVLDYAEAGIRAIAEKARETGLSERIAIRRHDVREPLPFADETFDACYSHMLYCMALTTSELGLLFRESRRVLRQNGLQVYTVRHTGDAHYGTGIHRGDDMYEVGGFIVHFFSRRKVEQLADGFELVDIDEFEEGSLPRKLFRVTLRKR